MVEYRDEMGFQLNIRDYRLHELNALEFEELVVRIAHEWLGAGVTPFAAGRDGGRDAKFQGTANSFPSQSAPWKGNFVIQAKHTSAPYKSCSDADFARLIKGESSKIANLNKSGLCENYILFTNRRLTGDSDKKLCASISTCGPKNAFIVGEERLHLEISNRSDLQSWLPNSLDKMPFRFDSDDLIEVIHALQDYAENGDDEAFDSAHDFEKSPLQSEKNKINNLSADYYKQIIIADSMPYFNQIRGFLRNPRNRNFSELYHDCADELKRKIITQRDNFDNFDLIFQFLIDAVQSRRDALKGRRRLVSIMVHYMYANCDIGSKADQELEDA